MSRDDAWLMASPPRGDRLAADTRWHVHHNRAVIAFRRDRVGATNDLTRHERAILGLAEGIDQYVELQQLTAPPPQPAASLRRRTSSSSVVAAQSSADTISSPSRP